jgi:hypothetical protein
MKDFVLEKYPWARRMLRPPEYHERHDSFTDENTRLSYFKSFDTAQKTLMMVESTKKNNFEGMILNHHK